MTTAYSPLLGLALPVTGELSGTWGDTVNNSITSLLDSAVAGTTTLSTDADVTLTTTTGAANTSREAILLFSGARTVLRTVTAPAASKIYTVINATTGGFGVKVVGAGPTTGVTIVAGESAVIAWNGSDFIKISNSGGAVSFTNVTVTGTTTLSGLTASTALALDASKNVVSVTNTGTGNNVLAVSPTITGTASIATLNLTNALTTAYGGTGLTSFTAGDLPYYATGTALSKLAIGTSGQILTSSGTAPQWSTLSGVAVTTFSAGTTGFTPNSATSGAITLAGTLATTNGGTGLTSFTANGVVYASSTSALATGSALTFDGANFRINGAASGSALSGDASVAAIRDLATANVASYKVIGGSSSTQIELFGSSSTTGLWTSTNTPMLFGVNNTEQMRLTSTGLGIGTSSPASKLQVLGPVGSFNDGAGTVRIETDAAGTDVAGTIGAGIVFAQRWTAASGPLRVGGVYGFKQSSTGNFGGGLAFYTQSNSGADMAERMRLDSAGNLGLGTTSPYAVNGKNFTVSDSLISRVVLENTAASGRNYYIGSVPAGGLNFYDITASAERMLLDSAGNLGLGVTPSAWNSSRRALQIGQSTALYSFSTSQSILGTNVYMDSGGTDRYLNSAAATQYVQSGGAHSWNISTSTPVAGTDPVFSQAMTLDASGNLLVGPTTQITSEKFGVLASGSSPAITAKNTAGSSEYTILAWNSATSGDNKFAGFLVDSGGGLVGGITYNRGAGLTAYNVTSDYRAKDIIGPVVDSGALIDSVPVYIGKMHGATQERPMFIAHETPSYAHTGEKDAVDADGKPVYQQMDASALVPVMWAELQSLRKRLAAAGI